MRKSQPIGDTAHIHLPSCTITGIDQSHQFDTFKPRQQATEHLNITGKEAAPGAFEFIPKTPGTGHTINEGLGPLDSANPQNTAALADYANRQSNRKNGTETYAALMEVAPTPKRNSAGSGSRGNDTFEALGQ